MLKFNELIFQDVINVSVVILMGDIVLWLLKLLFNIEWDSIMYGKLRYTLLLILIFYWLAYLFSIL
jgi:hypothetical protein